MATKPIAVVGAGRMGRGIALSYALAGAPVSLIDVKPRGDDALRALAKSNADAVEQDINFLVDLGLITKAGGKTVTDRIETVAAGTAADRLEGFSIIYEGVPEHRDAKETAFSWIGEHAPESATVASTTSTFLVDDLAEMLPNPARFANAHWLNPAHLMPLVELSKGENTSDETIDALERSLESAGKTTIVCGPTPGYIVPRIQALAMNEAARLAEEGAASVEDIDKAVRVGFGVRYAILGLLEFIDWGGGDILYYASDYLSKSVDKDRYTAPKIIHDNMHGGRNGVADGEGFYNYRNMDVAAYRKQRMQEFVGLLSHLKITPKIADDAKKE